MNVELQIMFHVLLFAVCAVIAHLRQIDHDIITRSRDQEIDTEGHILGLFLLTLTFFVPMEIILWILYWIFV